MHAKSAMPGTSYALLYFQKLGAVPCVLMTQGEMKCQEYSGWIPGVATIMSATEDFSELQN